MRLVPSGLARLNRAVPLAAAGVATGFVGIRLTTGSPLLSTGGDQVFVHHRARLDVLLAWHEYLAGDISLLSLLQRSDSEFPPMLHGMSLLLGSVLGHSAESILWTGLLWLFLLAASTGVVTARLLAPPADSTNEKGRPGRCSPATAGAAAASAILLLGSYQGMATRYYYDLPMTALLWAGAAVLLATWDQRPRTGGVLAGLLVTAACLTKWTAIPFALATGLGLLLTLFGSAQRLRARGTALVLAIVVTGGLSFSFMEASREGGNQSSLEVMGGTFDAKSGQPLSSEDLRSTLEDYLEPAEASPPPEAPSPLVLQQKLDAPARMSSLLWAQLGSPPARTLLVGSDGSADVARPGQWSPGPLPTSAMATADVDNDGDLDLAIAAGGRGFRAPNRLHRSKNGSLDDEPVWSSTETDYSTSVDWGDWDGDGDPDLAVGNGSGPLRNRVYRNTRGVLEGTAAWSSTEAEDTRAVAWGDWDADGDADLAVGNHLAANHVYVNDDGVLRLAWTSAEEDETTCLAWGDWEGDGDLDLAVGNNLGGPTRVYLNGGNSFELGWTSIEADSTLDIAWADWDGARARGRARAHPDAPDRVYETDGNELLLAWSSPEVRRTVALAWSVDEAGASSLALADEENNQILVYGSPTSLAISDATASLDNSEGEATRLAQAPETLAAAPSSVVETDQSVHKRSVRRRLAFYPRWLVKSVLSPALTLPLLLLLLCWLLGSRAGLALVLTTVFGQIIFLLLFVPPLDERFIMTLVPALIVAGAAGWSILPELVRRGSGAVLLALMLLVCWNFHFGDSRVFTTSEPFVRIQSLDALGLDNASYADGAWRRGDAERRAVQQVGNGTGPAYREFRKSLWGLVQRCEARQVVIGGSGSMVDDKDWWRYRVALHDGQRGTAATDRPGIQVIQDIDLSSMISDLERAPELVLSQVDPGAPAAPPSGVAHLPLRLDEQIRVEGMDSAIAVYRPMTMPPCPDANNR